MAIRNLPVRTVQEGVRIFYTNEGTVWGFAYPFVNEKYQCLKTSADLDERHQCAREIGSFLYDNYADIPMFLIKADLTVDPEFIEDYLWPGLTSAGVSHYHEIKGVRDFLMSKGASIKQQEYSETSHSRASLYRPLRLSRQPTLLNRPFLTGMGALDWLARVPQLVKGR